MLHSRESHQQQLQDPHEPCSEEGRIRGLAVRKEEEEVCLRYRSLRFFGLCSKQYQLNGGFGVSWGWKGSRFDDDKIEQLRTRVQQVIKQQHRALVGQVLAQRLVQPGKVDAICPVTEAGGAVLILALRICVLHLRATITPDRHNLPTLQQGAASMVPDLGFASCT